MCHLLTTGAGLGRVARVGDSEERLSALFDDLEQQAEAAFAVERDLEVADRAQAEYAQVDLASRLMASVGQEVSLRVAGIGPVSGTLERVADDWCLLTGDAGQWVIRLAAILTASGVSSRSVPEAAWPLSAKLSLRSALRGLASGAEPCRLITVDGSSYEARLGRVGADFVEAFAPEGSEPMLVRFEALTAIQQR